jgi:hypothetical protein
MMTPLIRHCLSKAWIPRLRIVLSGYYAAHCLAAVRPTTLALMPMFVLAAVVQMAATLRMTVALMTVLMADLLVALLIALIADLMLSLSLACCATAARYQTLLLLPVVNQAFLSEWPVDPPLRPQPNGL